MVTRIQVAELVASIPTLTYMITCIQVAERVASMPKDDAGRGSTATHTTHIPHGPAHGPSR